jgi:hypothetical protein
VFHEFFRWLAEDLGKSSPDGQSWSQALHESLNLWGVTEGMHVLTIMFFAGTIWIVDLRMMGLAFRDMPFSKLNDRVLPITVCAFAAMVLTGAIVFFGRDPLLYYHDVWFRFKMIFLVIASANIFWFHYRVQKNQAAWDAMEKPPAKVKLSGAISMVCWIAMIALGRFIAYDFLRCEKVRPGSFVYVFAECKQAMSYLDDIPAAEESGDATGDPGAQPAQGAPAEPTPATPTPGEGG